MGKDRRGQALVPVIFVTLILTALAIAFATSAVREVRAASNATSRTQSFYAARGALLYTMYALQQSSSNNVNYGIVQPGSDISVDSNGWWQMGDAWVKVDVVDTGAGINLNAATAAVLSQLPAFQNNPDLVAAIIDWRSSGEQASQNGAKSSYYQTLKPPYNCKDAPFDTVEELLLVRGMSPGLLYGNGAGQAIDSNAGPIGTGSAYTPAAQSASSGSSGSGSQGRPQFNDVYSNSRIALAELFTTVSQENNVAADGTKRVDINSATEQDLEKIGLTAAQAQQVISARSSAGLGGLTGGGNTTQTSTGSTSGGSATGSSGGPQMGGPSSDGGGLGSGGGTRFGRSRQSMGGLTGGGASGGNGASSGPGGSGNTGQGHGQGNGSGGQGNGQGNGQGSGSGGQGSTGGSQGFTNIAALLTVPGIDGATMQKIADYLTVDSGSTRNNVVNVNTAPAEVLATVPGMDRQILNAILSYRQNGQVFATLGDLFTLKGVSAAEWERVIEHLSTKSSFYKIHIQVRIPGQRAVYAVSALVQLTSSYPQLLQWREAARVPGWAYWTTPPNLPAPPIVSTTSTTSGSGSGHTSGG